jgi:NodT family efflux transporter outer membrane factor (OMF) lipoprotein
MRHSRFFAILLVPALLAGCSVGPDYVQPSAPLPASGSFKEFGGTWEPAKPSDDAIRGKWWEIYHDPALNALEEKVDISNQNVIEAEAQFREAAATVKIARAAFFPTVTANPSITESQASQHLTPSTSSSSSSSGSSIGGVSHATQHQGAVDISTYDLPMEATYMVDIWGSVRRNVESESATAEASFANLENMRLSYHATVAQDYFSLHGLDAEADLLTQTVKSYEDYLTLTKNRYASGIASQADVAEAQTQLDTTQAQLIDLGVARAEYEHAIAVLTGQPPSDFDLKHGTLPGQPPHVPVGVPSRLLERRPDVAQAERQVAAANAAIGVQVAGYFPQVSLSTQAGIQAINISDLFTGPSFAWSVGAAVAQTVFDAGSTHGKVQEAQANYDATVANYRLTVLTAMQQVEDDLAGLRILEKEAAAEDTAVKSANQSLEVNTNQYKAGIVDYLTVITAQATALNDEVQAVNIRTRRMTTSVLLVEALGGGWTSAALPGRAGVADVPQAQQNIDKTR